MKVRFVSFQGEVPRINARLLPENAAQIARNSRFEDGALVPLNLSAVVEALATPVDPIVTIYRRYDGTWLTWDVEVNASGGPVTDSDRTYYTGDGVPKVIYGAGAGTVHDLAVEPPAAALTVVADPGTPGIAADGTITIAGAGPSAGQIITIGGVAYTFVAALSTAPTVENEILINATPDTVAKSLRNALRGITGSTVSLGTVANPLVNASRSGAVVTVTAKTVGVAGNSIGFVNTTPASNTTFSPAGGVLDSGVDGIGELDPDTSEAVFYAYTYVTQWGEESQPSPLSDELICSPLQIIEVTDFVDPSARGITLYRLYRSQTDSLGETTLFFVTELTISTFVEPFLHDMEADPLQNSIPSLDWTVPVNTLKGLCAGPNGMMAAFKGKNLYFCEPYIPHAWPVKYSLSVDFPIVGLAAIGASFVVLTEGTPYILQGTHPASMVSTELEQNYPCVSARSIVDLGYSVVYASTEGLVRITNNGAELLTGTMFTTRQWQSQRGDTIIASQHFGAYIYTHLNEPGTERKGVIIDLTGRQPFLVQHDEEFTAAYFAPGEGSLYILLDGEDISLWDDPDSDRREQKWKSRLIHLPSPVNFGCYLMETDGDGAATLNVYADGILKHAGTVQNAVSRLPGNFLALKWEIEFVGTVKVTSLNLAISPSELAVT